MEEVQQVVVVVLLGFVATLLDARPQGFSEDESSLVFFPDPHETRQSSHHVTNAPIIFFPDSSQLVKNGTLTELRSEPSTSAPVIQTPRMTTTTTTTTTTPPSTTELPAQSFVPASAVATACSHGNTYCEDSDFYPLDFIENSLSVDGKLMKEYFRGDESMGVVFIDGFVPGRIRPDGTPDLVEETPVCAARESIIYPRVAKTQQGDWMFVVNQGEYIQGVRVEKCLEEGSACAISEGAELGFETVCRQKYIYRKLLAVNGSGSTVTDTFRMPSCCVCYTRSNFFAERSLPHRNRRRVSKASG